MADYPLMESVGDRESRALLIHFLEVTDGVLDRLLQTLFQTMNAQNVPFSDVQLHDIWSDARERLKRVVSSVRRGLSKYRRNALAQIGMFGKSLEAKFDLLSFDVREGAVKRVMARLNSMLSSLSKVFPALHAVKEFKDHVEVTMDSLKQPIEFITLGDLLRQE